MAPVPLLWLALACAALAFGVPAHPASDQAGAAPQQAVSARFALGGNAAEIPAKFVGNLVFLPARVNSGLPSSFELDTTAARSAVAPARGAAATGSLPNAVIGFPGVEFSLAALPIASRSDIEAAVGEEYHGKIGDDVLSAIVLVLNYRRQTVQMYDPAAHRPEKSQTAALPLSFSGDVPVIHARFILEKGKPVEGEFALDTSLDASVVFSNAFAERHKMFSSRVKTVSTIDPELGADRSVALARMKTFEIGTSSMANLIGEFPQRGWTPPGGASLAGAIGGGILRRFTVTLDFPHHQAYLDPNARFEDYDQEDKSGLALIAAGPGLKQFEVVYVQAGSPAANAGIQKGDLIAGMDGEAAADMTLADVRDLLRGAGYKRKLEMERNGKTYEVTLDLTRLL